MEGVHKLLDRWRSRYWRPQPGAGTFEGLTPFVVVTGASEGIGRELALEFACHRHPVLLIARRAGLLEVLAAQIAREHGVKAVYLALDVTAVDAGERIEAALGAAGGYCDILINNAGIGASGPFAGEDPQRVAELIALNVTALTVLTRRFLPDMLARGAGGVLNVASMAGLIPGPHQAAYYASKAYVISLTEALAEETAGLGVRLSALAPGPVATKFHARMGAEQSYYRRLIGAQSALQVARAGYRWFRWGRTLIIPGPVRTLSGVALRILPHMVMVPVIGWLLKRRQTGGDHV